MHRIVGGVEVQDQLLGRGAMRANEGLDEDLGNPTKALAIHTVLQAAQGRRRRQRPVFLNRPLTQHVKQNILPQALMIVEVFITEGNPEDPLGQQGPLRMGDEEGVAGIGEAGVDRIDQTQRSIHLTQQHGSAVRGQPAAAKVGLNILAFEP